GTLNRDEYHYTLYTLEKLSIPIKTADATKPYDGKPLTKNEVVIAAGSLAEGHTIVLQITGSRTTVGSSENSCRDADFKIVDQDENNVTHNYNYGEILRGTLTVT
ncbi:MAG: hypothetical protein J6V07_02085, partial [Clostridia bacterium]|nr:hypothetical protein [Clostridia bacterium]